MSICLYSTSLLTSFVTSCRLSKTSIARSISSNPSISTSSSDIVSFGCDEDMIERSEGSRGSRLGLLWEAVHINYETKPDDTRTRVFWTRLILRLTEATSLSTRSSSAWLDQRGLIFLKLATWRADIPLDFFRLYKVCASAY